MMKLAWTMIPLLLAAPALAQTTASTKQFEPAPVQPDPAPPPVKGQTLEQMVATPAWQAPVIAAAKAQFTGTPGGCAAAKYQATGNVTVFQPVQFGADGKPYAGLWAEAVSVTGCGPARQLNVLSIAHADGDPAHVALMPGTSHADPIMQKAALQYAQAVTSRSPPPGCRQVAFTEARFVKYDGPPNPEVKDGRDARPWDEDWLVQACGSTYVVNIRFKPNATGTELAGSNPVKEH